MDRGSGETYRRGAVSDRSKRLRRAAHRRPSGPALRPRRDNRLLEPDALAFRIGDKLELVEIKSYPIIDGQGDPAKLSATAGQTSVYHIALRGTLERLGFDPDLLQWSVILVAPRNFGRTPTAHRIPLKKKSMALERVLRSVPQTADVVAKLPRDFTFDVNADGALDDDATRAALVAAISTVEAFYVPECVQNCDMAKFCRSEAWGNDDPARLGRQARDSLAGVHSLADALRLATTDPAGVEEALTDVAEGLRDAQAALERARARVPTAGVAPPDPKRGPT